MKVDGQGVGPPDYEKRILVAVAGLSPQIVTETLYALAHQASPFWPTEIHLITTLEGARHAKLMLTNTTPGYLWKLCEELGLPVPGFSDACVHVLRNDENEPLLDIRSAADNTAVANQVIRLIRGFCASPESALHVSIAGGRKTMGYYAGYALSLFGRPQDRLSHVLVDAAFESHRSFFFPTKKSEIIYDRDDRPLDTKDACVELANIPFIRLRDGLPRGLMKGKQGFADLVGAAQVALEPVTLTIHRREGFVEVSGHVLSLSDTDLAMLLWFARRVEAGEEPFRPPGPDEFDGEAAESFLNCFEEIQEMHGGNDSRPIQSLSRGMEEEWFNNRVKCLKRRLSEELGTALAEQARVKLVSKRPARYALGVSPERLEIF